MGKVRVVLNSEGVRQVMKTEEARADMERRARAIADGAGPGHEVESEIGRTRARAAVYTKSVEAMRREATVKSLTRAIDRGRA